MKCKLDDILNFSALFHSPICDLRAELLSLLHRPRRRFLAFRQYQPSLAWLAWLTCIFILRRMVLGRQILFTSIDDYNRRNYLSLDPLAISIGISTFVFVFIRFCINYFFCMTPGAFGKTSEAWRTGTWTRTGEMGTEFNRTALASLFFLPGNILANQYYTAEGAGTARRKSTSGIGNRMTWNGSRNEKQIRSQQSCIHISLVSSNCSRVPH